MNRNGFSLLELLVVISIITVLVSATISSFSLVLKKIEVSGQVDVIRSAIYLAKSEAVKRNQVITICKSLSKVSCDGSWSNGWLVFADNNANGSIDMSEKLIATGSLKKGYVLTWSAFGSNDYIRFMSNGMSSSNNGTFEICSEDKDVRLARAIFISKTGRVRSSTDKNQDGIYENSAGNNLECG